MDTDRVKEIEDNYTTESVMRWILFGVLVVAFIPVLTTVHRMIAGQNVNLGDCMKDVFLAVVSVCCNLLNSCVDTKKKVNYKLRWIMGIIVGSVGFRYLLLFYDMSYNPIEFVEEELEYWFWFSSVIILISTIVGVIIEWYSNRKEKKKDEKKDEDSNR